MIHHEAWYRETSPNWIERERALVREAIHSITDPLGLEVEETRSTSPGSASTYWDVRDYVGAHKVFKAGEWIIRYGIHGEFKGPGSDFDISSSTAKREADASANDPDLRRKLREEFKDHLEWSSWDEDSAERLLRELS